MKTTLSELPDLAQSFGRIKTLIELEDSVNSETVLGYCIKLAFIQKKPHSYIISTIKYLLMDNRNAVENCIPKSVVEDIIKYWPE